MQFKSVNVSFRPWRRLFGFVLATGLVLGTCGSSHAATTFSKIASVGVNDASFASGSTVITTSGSTTTATAYYFANWALPADPASSFFLTSDNKTYGKRSINPATAVGSTSVFPFQLTSAATTYSAASTGQTVYLVAVMTDSAGNLASPLSYLSFTDSSGSDTGVSNCIQKTDFLTANTSRCVAIPYSGNAGTAANVYVKPGSACDLAAPSSTSPCSSAASFSVLTTANTLMYVSFRVISYATGTLPTAVADITGATLLESGNVTLSFQQSQPAISACTSDASYYPGDGQIFANVAGLSVSTTNSTRAPILDGIAGFNTGTTLLGTRPAMASASDAAGFQTLKTGLAYAANATIEGFTNTTSTQSYYHNVALSIRDATGLVAPANGCGIAAAQSAEIRGLLKNSKCFIATAAYASADVPPVKMLRKFRDQVLAPTEWGREFIAWYYAWSPPAAEWLLDRPIARAVVLIALIPVEIFAWFALHIGLALSAAAVIASAGVGLLAWRSRRSWA